MSCDQRWRVYVKNLEAKILIGIHPHESTPQRVIVNASVECDYPAKPSSIDECYSYETIYDLVASWPSRPHTHLLETYVSELLTHIFKTDSRVAAATISISKPDIYKDAQAVGVEATWTRADYQRHS